MELSSTTHTYLEEINYHFIENSTHYDPLSQ
jgi:hypothetical protein